MSDLLTRANERIKVLKEGLSLGWITNDDLEIIKGLLGEVERKEAVLGELIEGLQIEFPKFGEETISVLVDDEGEFAIAPFPLTGAYLRKQEENSNA